MPGAVPNAMVDAIRPDAMVENITVNLLCCHTFILYVIHVRDIRSCTKDTLYTTRN